MPRRAAPGDRAKLEAALSPTLRAALQELRELHDLHDWQDSAAGPLFQQSAVLHLATRLVREHGLRSGAALEAAARELGLSADTVRDRSKRWPAESRRGAKKVDKPLNPPTGDRYNKKAITRTTTEEDAA